jgi:phosphate transport system substrate-binding protein
MYRRKLTQIVLAGFAASFLSGCNSSSSTGTVSDPSDASGNAAASSSGGTVKLQGSGASFPAPLYGRWFKEYTAATSGVKVDYQAKGSGGGIKDFTEHTVDFGASDAAMEDSEISQVDQPIVMLPMTAGSVVLTYNLPDVKQPLKFSREAYSKIFLGQITNWNDPAIAKSNDGVTLPNMPITVVHRADSSGTTYVFTNHLSAISPEFAKSPGVGKSVTWPKSDKFIAAPKNDGVTAMTMQTPGAIGYVEYGFAEQAKLPMALLENKSGKFVEPSLANATAALAAVEMPEDLRAWLPDPEGESAYPIVTYTWLLCYTKYDDANKATELKKLIRWCLTEGQKASAEMGYVPLPENVVTAVTAKLDSIQ